MSAELINSKNQMEMNTFPERIVSNSFSTTQLTKAEKVEFWREITQDRVVPLDFNVDQPNDFEASLHWSQIGDINISNIQATPHMAIRTLSNIKHSDADSMVFNLLMSGQCYAEQDSTLSNMRTELGNSTAWFCNATRPYSLHFDTPFHLITLKIPMHRIASNISGIDRLVATDLTHASQLYPLVQSYILQLSELASQFNHSMSDKIATNLADLIGTLISEHIANDEVSLSNSKVASLLRVRSYIEGHLHDPDLTPGKVSEAMHLSTRYINQILQQEETSLGRLIWQRRLEKVSRLLRDPANQSNNISVYAYACGFNDMTHFCKIFRKRFDMSPREYRRYHLAPKDNEKHIVTS